MIFSILDVIPPTCVNFTTCPYSTVSIQWQKYKRKQNIYDWKKEVGNRPKYQQVQDAVYCVEPYTGKSEP